MDALKLNLAGLGIAALIFAGSLSGGYAAAYFFIFLWLLVLLVFVFLRTQKKWKASRLAYVYLIGFFYSLVFALGITALQYGSLKCAVASWVGGYSTISSKCDASGCTCKVL